MEPTGLMSPIPCPPLPADTARAAESLFGRDHPYMRAGEALDAVWGELKFSALQSTDTFLTASFYPCALATTVQYWEQLTDRQMSQAIRTRVDIKYALHLPLSYPGIEAATLCEFRQHVLTDAALRMALADLMQRLSEFGNCDKSSTDLSQVIAAICLPSRAEMILEYMGIALEAVATCDPNWLRANAQPHWYRRYNRKLDTQKVPHGAAEIERAMQAVGEDGLHLLQAIEQTGASSLGQLPEIMALRGQWQRQFEWTNNSLRFRRLCNLTCESNFSII